jgi:hypothetical protein
MQHVWEEERNTYRVLVGKAELNRSLASCEDDIKVDLKLRV